jgi:hypothetical protein
VSEACAEIAELMSKVEEGARRAQEEEEEGVRRQSKHKDHYMVELEQGKYADLLMMGGRSSVSSGYNSLSQGGGSESGDSLLGRPSLQIYTFSNLYLFIPLPRRAYLHRARLVLGSRLALFTESTNLSKQCCSRIMRIIVSYLTETKLFRES